MQRWRAVVFDLDDTLYPERDFVRSGFQAVAAWASQALGEPQTAVFDDLWGMFEAGVRHDTFDRWLQRRGHDVELRRRMIEAYRTHSPCLVLYPDVTPALQSLRGQVQLGLITEGARPVQEAKLNALGIRPWFDRVVILGEEERPDWRPSRRAFDLWLQGSRLGPGDLLYVGDNPAKDFLGARRAGWASLRVRRADGLHRDEEPTSPEARPDGEIADLRGLEAMLTTVEFHSA